MKSALKTRTRTVWIMGVLGMLCLVVAILLRPKPPPASPAPSSAVGKAAPSGRPLRITGQNSLRGRVNSQFALLSLPSAISSTGTGAFNDRALIEVCLADAATKLPISTGRIAIKEEHSRQILSDGELGGRNCVLIQADPGRYTLQVGASGYMAVEESLAVNTNHDRLRKVFSLGRSFLMRGIVRNLAGQPQPDVYISLFQDSYHVTVRSGTGGRFEAEFSSPEIQKIYAFKPPHPIVIMGPIVIRESKEPNLEITLPADSVVVRISGTVSDDLRHPVADAQVTLLASYTQHVPDAKHDAVLQGLQQISDKSDAKGRYLLEALPQNEGLLTVSGAKGCDLSTESITLLENAVKNIHLKCHPTFSVGVQDDGTGIFADSIIVAESPDGESAIVPTQEKARYVARTYPFRIFAWSRWPGQQAYGITKSEWIKSYRESILLVPGQAHVEGTVRLESGEPVQSFSVRVHLSESSGNITFPFTSEDGSFRLKCLPPGVMTLEVMGQITGEDGELVLMSFSQELTLVEGQTAFLAAILKRRATATCGLKDGRPIPVSRSSLDNTLSSSMLK